MPFWLAGNAVKLRVMDTFEPNLPQWITLICLGLIAVIVLYSIAVSMWLTLSSTSKSEPWWVRMATRAVERFTRG